MSPNTVLKDELWKYNKINPDKVFVSGIPHYDACIGPRETSREKFFQKMGLDPNKKLILFAPAGDILYKYDGEILKLFQELKNKNVFSQKVQFLVRFPPADTIDLNGFEKDEDFVFDEPGINISGVKKESELTRKAAEHLNDSLYYSDIVVAIVSTIAIDAAVFDKPTIILNIKGHKFHDIKKFLLYDHFKKFISFGLCTLAESESEFIFQVNAYLENLNLDKYKRKEIIRKYCYRLDGHSSKRVARFILQHLSLA